jgi:hypothetical protein
MRKKLIVGLAALGVAFGTALAGEEKIAVGGHVSFSLANIQMATGSGQLFEGDFRRIGTFGAGVDFHIPVVGPWALAPGIQVECLGSRYVEDFAFGGFATHEDVKAAATYLTFPILGRYVYSLNADWSLFGSAGPYLAFLLGGRAKGGISGDDALEIDEDLKDYAKGTDIGLILGAGLLKRLGKISIFADLRFRWGLTNGLDEKKELGLLNLTARNTAFTLTVGILTTALTTRVKVDSRENPR